MLVQPESCWPGGYADQFAAHNLQAARFAGRGAGHHEEVGVYRRNGCAEFLGQFVNLIRKCIETNDGVAGERSDEVEIFVQAISFDSNARGIRR